MVTGGYHKCGLKDKSGDILHFSSWQQIILIDPNQNVIDSTYKCCLCVQSLISHSSVP